MFEIIDVNKLPTLDLHGEYSDIAKVLINTFNKSVEEFKLYWFNDGMTIVKLKK